MATVFIPAQLRKYASGQSEVVVDGTTLGALVAELDMRFPGFRDRIVEGDRLASWLSLVVDGSLADKSLWTEIGSESEVHFLPAISGGQSI